MKLSQELNASAKKDAALKADIKRVAISAFLKRNNINGTAWAPQDGSFGIKNSNHANIVKFCETLIKEKFINKMPQLNEEVTQVRLVGNHKSHDELVIALFGKEEVKKAKNLNSVKI